MIADGTGHLRCTLAGRLARANVTVHVVRSAGEVDPLRSEWDYDVAVLDAALPDEAAADLCRRIRAAARSCSILVWAETEDALEAVCCYDAGADDYVGQSVDPIVLEAKIRRAMLRTREAPRGAAVPGRDSSIDDLRDRVHVEVPGVDVRRLTRLEERLLAILSRARGGLVRSDEIVAELWGSTNMESRALYEHVSTLRAKLHELGWTVVNVRGQGYKLAREDAPLAEEDAHHSAILAVSQDNGPDSWQSTG